jgi:hypothetical protein
MKFNLTKTSKRNYKGNVNRMNVEIDIEHHLAAKLEKDTQRRQDDGQDDVYAVCCAFIRHLSVAFLFS